MDLQTNVTDGLKNITGSLFSKIFFILLVASLTANVFQFYAKGITIDKSDRSDRSDRRVSHQEQMQGQLFIQNGYVQGNHIEWITKVFEVKESLNKPDNTIAEIESYLTSLSPSSSYMSYIYPVVKNGRTIEVRVLTPNIITQAK